MVSSPIPGLIDGKPGGVVERQHHRGFLYQQAGESDFVAVSGWLMKQMWTRAELSSVSLISQLVPFHGNEGAGQLSNQDQVMFTRWILHW